MLAGRFRTRSASWVKLSGDTRHTSPRDQRTRPGRTAGAHGSTAVASPAASSPVSGTAPGTEPSGPGRHRPLSADRGGLTECPRPDRRLLRGNAPAPTAGVGRIGNAAAPTRDPPGRHNAGPGCRTWAPARSTARASGRSHGNVLGPHRRSTAVAPGAGTMGSSTLAVPTRTLAGRAPTRSRSVRSSPQAVRRLFVDRGHGHGQHRRAVRAGDVIPVFARKGVPRLRFGHTTVDRRAHLRLVPSVPTVPTPARPPRAPGRRPPPRTPRPGRSVICLYKLRTAF